MADNFAKPFLTAEWRYLVMLNYEIEPAILLPLVPKGTELDTWNGKTFVSMVGFHFRNTRVMGWGIPFHQDFEEINLRFYVRHKAEDGWRRGVRQRDRAAGNDRAYRAMALQRKLRSPSNRQRRLSIQGYGEEG